jgi:hypothetical protein
MSALDHRIRSMVISFSMWQTAQRSLSSGSETPQNTQRGWIND